MLHNEREKMIRLSISARTRYLTPTTNHGYVHNYHIKERKDGTALYLTRQFELQQVLKHAKMNKMVVGVQMPHLRLSQNTNPIKRRKVIRRPSVSQTHASYVNYLTMHISLKNGRKKN